MNDTIRSLPNGDFEVIRSQPKPVLMPVVKPPQKKIITSRSK